MPRGCSGGRGARSRRLSVGRWRGIFFNGHAEFVKGAGVLRVFGRDAFLDWLGAFKLCAGIEKAALLAAVQCKLALGTRAIGIEPWGQHGATIGTSCAGDRADHAGGTGAELIGATRPAGRRLAVVGFVFFFVFFRVPVTALIKHRNRKKKGFQQTIWLYSRCRSRWQKGRFWLKGARE